MVIDLGVLEPAAPDRDEPWLGRPGARRSTWEFWRRLLVVATAAVTVATATAAAPVPRGAVPTLIVAVSEVAESIVDRDALHVLTSRPGRAQLTSYRLSDGTVRWNAPIDAPEDGSFSLVARGGVLVVNVWHGTERPGESIGRATAYDPRTGAAMWRLDGLVIGPALGGRLLLSREFPIPPAASGWTYEYAAIDPRSPTPVWSLRLAGDEARQVALDWPGPSVVGSARLVTMSDAGLLRSYNLATGSMLAERQLREWQRETQVDVVGDIVLLTALRDAVVRVSAYGVDDLMPRWEAAGRGGWRAAGCRPWVCVPTNGGVRAVDPVTGAQAWERAGLLFVDEAGPPWPSGSLFAERMDGTGIELVDAVTGRTVADLGAWSTIEQPDGPPLVIRSPARSPGTRGAWLGQFRPGLGVVEIVAALPDVRFCMSSGDYLVCRTMLELRVWAIRA
jgi:hypothetical protein